MALYMDVHSLDGSVKAADVAAAHARSRDAGRLRSALPALLGG